MIQTQPAISIMIPAKNGGVLFEQVLKQIRSQEYNNHIEIVVIDSGSTDDTISYAKTYQSKVIEISPDSFNHGRTRNFGIANTTGEFVVLLTQDAVPANTTFISEMITAIQRQNAAGAYARQIPCTNASWLVKRNLQNWISGNSQSRVCQMNNANQFFSTPPAEQHLQCVFENVASVIRREVWEKIPFPDVPFGEDLDWGFRILCNGYTLVYASKAIVNHSHERPPEYTYKRTYIDHYRLYELFGMRTIPSISKIGRSVALTTFADWLYLLQNITLSQSWWKEFSGSPQHAWASAWGQYAGAKAAAKGIHIQQIQGV